MCLDYKHPHLSVVHFVKELVLATEEVNHFFDISFYALRERGAHYTEL
jgi:hypothetical protein